MMSFWEFVSMTIIIKNPYELSGPFTINSTRDNGVNCREPYEVKVSCTIRNGSCGR